MYKQTRVPKTTLKENKSLRGRSIEAKVRKMVHDKEPIEDGAELVYQDREAGVDPAFNIRTDRWELAAEAMDKVTKDKLAKREGTGKSKDEPGPGKGGEETPPKE